MICALLDEVRQEQAEHQHFLGRFKVHLVQKTMRALKRNRVREQDLRIKKLAMVKRVKHWQLVKAMQNWRLYTSKLLQFKKDPITLRFLEYEGAVIDQYSVGQPLVVLESSDSCKFFDVNAIST